MPQPRLPLPSLGENYNPGNARWCEKHSRLECTKNRTKGRGRCHCRAIKGMDACMSHCGRKTAVAKVIGEARITAWNPMGRPTKPISASMAVLGVLQMSYLRLRSYSELLRQQVETEGRTADDPATVDEPSASGLIGFRYGAAGKDGTVYVQSEEVRALVNLEASERDRVVKYAKIAHDMGISERLTKMAERWGDLVADQISKMFGELDLTPEQNARVPVLVQSYLGSIDLDALGDAEDRAA